MVFNCETTDKHSKWKLTKWELTGSTLRANRDSSHHCFSEWVWLKQNCSEFDQKVLVVAKPLPPLLYQPIGMDNESLAYCVKLCSYTVIKVTWTHASDWSPRIMCTKGWQVSLDYLCNKVPVECVQLVDGSAPQLGEAGFARTTHIHTSTFAHNNSLLVIYVKITEKNFI